MSTVKHTIIVGAAGTGKSRLAYKIAVGNGLPYSTDLRNFNHRFKKGIPFSCDIIIVEECYNANFDKIKQTLEENSHRNQFIFITQQLNQKVDTDYFEVINL